MSRWMPVIRACAADAAALDKQPQRPAWHRQPESACCPAAWLARSVQVLPQTLQRNRGVAVAVACQTSSISGWAQAIMAESLSFAAPARMALSGSSLAKAWLFFAPAGVSASIGVFFWRDFSPHLLDSQAYHRLCLAVKHIVPFFFKGESPLSGKISDRAKPAKRAARHGLRS